MRDTSPAPAHATDNMQSRLGRSAIIRLITAFVLALLTWGWVMELTDPITSEKHSEVEIVVPEFEDNLVMVTSLPRGTITVEGPESEVEGINRSMLRLQVDTTSVTEPGEYRLPVIVESPDSSARITVEPKNVVVQVDEITARVIPLEIQETAMEDTTREINNITTDVSQVTVSGPSSAVNRVDSVVLPVTIDAQVSSFSDYFIPYAVDENDQRVSEVTVLPGQVLTRVELQTRGRVVPVIADIQGQPADGYSVQQSRTIPTTVLVEGPDEVLDELLFVYTEPIDISGASSSVSSRVGFADLPEGVSIVEPISGQIEVRVAIQDTTSTTQTLTEMRVSALNTPEGLSVNIEPETVDVTVQGSIASLTEMTPDDIAIVVDVQGLSEGEYTLRPILALPGGVIGVGTNPETVTVTIEKSSSTPEAVPATATPGAETPEAIAPTSDRRSSSVRRALRTR